MSAVQQQSEHSTSGAATLEAAPKEKTEVEGVGFSAEVAKVRKLHQQIEESDADNLKKAIEVGCILSSVKEKVGHGDWGKWLQHNFKFTDRTARNYLKVYQEDMKGNLKEVTGYTDALQVIRKGKARTKGDSSLPRVKFESKKKADIEAGMQDVFNGHSNLGWSEVRAKNPKDLLPKLKALIAKYGNELKKDGAAVIVLRLEA